MVHMQKKETVTYPESWKDYTAEIDLKARPAGIDIGFLCNPYGEISWNEVPGDAEFFRG